MVAVNRRRDTRRRQSLVIGESMAVSSIRLITIHAMLNSELDASLQGYFDTNQSKSGIRARNGVKAS